MHGNQIVLLYLFSFQMIVFLACQVTGLGTNFNIFLLIKSLDLVGSYIAQAERIAHNIGRNFNVSSEIFFLFSQVTGLGPEGNVLS